MLAELNLLAMSCHTADDTLVALDVLFCSIQLYHKTKTMKQRESRTRTVGLCHQAAEAKFYKDISYDMGFVRRRSVKYQDNIFGVAISDSIEFDFQ